MSKNGQSSKEQSDSLSSIHQGFLSYSNPDSTLLTEINKQIKRKKRVFHGPAFNI